MHEEFLDGRIVVKVGDLTAEDTDAIVNAANWTLLGGGGVDGAIHRKGGAAIREECQALRDTIYPDGLPTGEAVVTSGGLLPAKFVIHTVGPIYGQNGGRDAALLAKSYLSSIKRAEEYDLHSIAFPSISTGAFGYPKHEAARVVSETLTATLADASAVELVRLVFFGAQDAEKFLKHARF